MEKLVNSDRSPVRLKGLGKALCITLDPRDPFDYIKDEIEKIFRDLKQLAVNSRVVFDFEGYQGYDHLVDELGNFLKQEFNVHNVSGPLKKKKVLINKSARQDDMERSWQKYQSEALILSGRVRSGQKVAAANHLVILGDVNPGAEVFAGGDILVLGSLRGTAVAGHPNNENSIILALDFRPMQVQIGGYVAAGNPNSDHKGLEFAYVEEGSIIVEDYLKADPFGRLPWPQVR